MGFVREGESEGEEVSPISQEEKACIYALHRLMFSPVSLPPNLQSSFSRSRGGQIKATERTLVLREESRST